MLIKRIFSTAIYSAISRFFFTASNLFIIYFITRYLSKLDLGDYSIVFIIMQLFSLGSSLGIYQYYSKQIGQVRDNKGLLSAYLNDFYSVTLNGIVLSIPVFLITILFYHHLPLSLMFLGFSVGILLGIEINLGGILLGLEKMKWEACFQFFSFLILVIAFYNFKTGMSLGILLIIRSILHVGGILARYTIINKGWINKKIGFKLKFWREEKFYLFINIVFYIYRHADLLILSLFTGKGELGGYFLGVRIYFALSLLAEVVSFALTPFISRVFKQKEHKSFNRFVWEIFIFSILGGCACGLLLFFGGDLIIGIFNPELREATSWIVKWLAIAVPFRFSAHFLGNILTSSQYQHIRFYMMSAVSSVFLLSSYFLIKFMALKGAVISRVGVEIIVFLTYIIFIFSKVIKANER